MKNEIDVTDRAQLEKALIEAEKMSPVEVTAFSLEELEYFWLIHLFESRKQDQESEDLGR